MELNTASAPLLSRVAGIGPSLAKRIVAHRNEKGAFKSRKGLLEVAGIGPKTFEQAAGFLRVRGGEHPLDASAVHPERYPLVEKMAGDLGVPVASLVGDLRAVDRIDAKRYVDGDVGAFTLGDILAELKKPGRDPRATFEPPKFRDDVRELSDLKPGMELEGVVTNVTAFGAFVDVGVHQDGLVHVSQLADRFVKDPSEVVKVGEKIKVRVLEVDLDRKRIALSAKKGGAPAAAGQGQAPAQGRLQGGAAAEGRREAAAGAAGQAEGGVGRGVPQQPLRGAAAQGLVGDQGCRGRRRATVARALARSGASAQAFRSGRRRIASRTSGDQRCRSASASRIRSRRMARCGSWSVSSARTRFSPYPRSRAMKRASTSRACSSFARRASLSVWRSSRARVRSLLRSRARWIVGGAAGLPVVTSKTMNRRGSSRTGLTIGWTFLRWLQSPQLGRKFVQANAPAALRLLARAWSMVHPSA